MIPPRGSSLDNDLGIAIGRFRSCRSFFPLVSINQIASKPPAAPIFVEKTVIRSHHSLRSRPFVETAYESMMEVEEMEQGTAAMSLGGAAATDINAAEDPSAPGNIIPPADAPSLGGDEACVKESPQNASMDVEDEQSTTSSTDDTKDTILHDDDDEDVDEEQKEADAGTSAPAGDENAAEILLLKAANLKEEGNQLFKDGQLEKAARSYRRGVASIKKLNQMNTGDDQVKALLCTLHTNLSTVLYKCAKYKQSADVAGQAIAVLDVTTATTTTTVKPYYRRAVALRKVGAWDEARADLKMALSIDPSNTDCAKELSAIKKEVDSMKSSQKKAYAKAFSGGSLYNDKEEAAERQRQEKAQKKQLEEELQQQRKQQWEDECVSRMAKGEEAIPFDDWDKQRKEKEEKEKETADAKRKEEKRRREERRRQDESKNKVEPNDSDDDELTAEECKLLRGYKKTADGRTTSYFTRELSADDMNILGSTTPQRLDDVRTNATTTIGVDNDNAGGVSSSKWNHAGTWEEKDTTAYCKPQLEQRLQKASVQTDDGYTVDITKVESLTGHSSVAIVSGKKRYIFDFEAKLKYTIKYMQEQEIAKGVVHMPDMSSANAVAHEMETQYEAWKKGPNAQHMERATNLRKDLTDSLIAQVKLFIEDLNAAY
jgi:tetratricopeptide (TPR) repeat protein